MYAWRGIYGMIGKKEARNHGSHQTAPGAGLSNCRDLGGYAAADGVTRFGVFLRSEAPCGLPEAGGQYLRQWGLGETIDLRGEAEIAWRPSALAGVLPYRVISLSGGADFPLRRRGDF